MKQNKICLRAGLVAIAAMVFGVSPVQSAEGDVKVALKEIAAGFVSPTVLTSLPDGTGRLLVADQIGVIYVLQPGGGRDVFLDLRDRLTKLNQGFDERGLLGLVLHPEFRQNGRFYVYYSAPLRRGAPNGWNHTSHISEFKVMPNAAGKAEPKSERVLLTIDQPQFNHNGGRLAFGPDGFLYIAVGDGGQANDTGLGHAPQGNGQDTSTLLGKILRIDVNGGNPFAVPRDNPFANGGGRPEIFAYGFRNPWGISFDSGGKHQLFAADVGQDSFEEVNIVEKGGNYGWRIREGFVCFDPNAPTKAPADCPKVGADGKPLLDPILVYKNFKAFRNDPEARGISVTGGYVYRGSALPQLQGRYVFADWSRNWVLPMGVLFVATAPQNGEGKWSLETVSVEGKSGNIGAYIVAFGEDADRELYVLTNGSNSLSGNSGKISKLVAQ